MSSYQDILNLGLDSNLAIGKQYKIVCPACNRKILSICNTGTHIKALCHSTRCIHNKGYSIPLKLGSLSSTQLQEISKKQRQESGSGWYLPSDTTSNIPHKFIEYLKRYEVDKLIDKYQLAYTPYQDRLILPCTDGGYLGRSLEDQPKWLTFTDNDHFISVFNPKLNTNKLCIVEDPISAIKVGEVTRCIALLSTTITNNLFYKLAKLPNPTTVYIWLDGDIAGYKGIAKLSSRLSQLSNLKIKLVSEQDKDPKDCSYFKINNNLNG